MLSEKRLEDRAKHVTGLKRRLGSRLQKERV
jgi:hypothetical protein